MVKLLILILLNTYICFDFFSKTVNQNQTLVLLPLYTVNQLVSGSVLSLLLYSIYSR